MLLCPQADFRQVQDLTAFCDAAWDSAEVLTATSCRPWDGDVPLHLAALPYRACVQDVQPDLQDAFRSDDEHCVADAQAHQKMAAYCSFDCLWPICLPGP